MLILTRRLGESILIGDNITVTVVSTKGNQVKLAIDAPRDIVVNREEVAERIRRQNQQ
ncbi:carbon storage regulator CsrA [Pseudomonas sp. TUM22785]|uniref:carbon storage regulator CsrA n=1 Tax=Pseudomonas sp. TUM22785 TaxID=3019098 RepID=UPI0023067994|nr:carbon storage regulator CsrA [Pseudomonas sp. TUM22785]WCD82968.1 carbon storage regulator CsrA [Pseudomonas sp. TUM22785]